MRRHQRRCRRRTIADRREYRAKVSVAIVVVFLRRGGRWGFAAAVTRFVGGWSIVVRRDDGGGNSAGLPLADVCSITFGRLGAFLHLALFHAWSDAICDNEKPPIEFPVDCLVGRYALPVVYFVAGWTLYSASKAATIAAEKRPLYFMFAASHTCDERAAKTLSLPISLVERRKRRASVYCSREYFDFICRVESIFLANLTLKMMLAYNDGDIVTRIKKSILLHDGMRVRFSRLLGSENEVDNQLILSYIIERYANMRGTYFAKLPNHFIF